MQDRIIANIGVCRFVNLCKNEEFHAHTGHMIIVVNSNSGDKCTGRKQIPHDGEETDDQPVLFLFMPCADKPRQTHRGEYTGDYGWMSMSTAHTWTGLGLTKLCTHLWILWYIIENHDHCSNLSYMFALFCSFSPHQSMINPLSIHDPSVCLHSHFSQLWLLMSNDCFFLNVINNNIKYITGWWFQTCLTFHFIYGM